MRIETKFTPGQKVWAIYNNKVQEFMVETVEVTSRFNYDTNKPNEPFSKYKLRAGESAGYRVEVYEFELEKNYALSKEELLKSL
jgi:hypothetical protein|nr:MAG TPA: hypothetical protein [Caudoviricetes sp.]